MDRKNLYFEPAYLQTQIKEISDPDLFAALDLSLPGLEEVARAAAAGDWAAAYGAWASYVAGRPEVTLVPHPDEGLCTSDEYLRVMAGRPEQVRQVLAEAEAIMAHKIRGWGDKVIEHGAVVDFNADYGVTGQYGFLYWGWAIPLIQAGLLTGDRRYPDKFAELFLWWYEQRNSIHGQIPKWDAIYYELGLGGRSPVFLSYYRLFKHQAPAQLHGPMLKALLGAGRWLCECENEPFRAGNWPYIGSFGLLQIGLGCPEFREAPAWTATALRVFEEHARLDVYQDGCHSERCSGYMALCYRFNREALNWLQEYRRLRGAVASEECVSAMTDAARRMLAWFMQTVTPLGLNAPFNDDGRFSLATLLLQGAWQFGDGSFAWPVRDQISRWPGHVTPQPPDFTSANLPFSRFAVMRSGWDREALYMIVNYGPTGGGHSHLDILDFELYGFGQALAVDSSIGLTYDDPNHQPWYRRSFAHNMLVVDGDDLDRNAADGERPVWLHTPAMDFLAAEHRGYEASKGIIHRRSILFVRPDPDRGLPGYWLVADRTLETPEAHRFSWYLHRPHPGLLVIPVEPATVTTRRGAGPAAVQGLGFGTEHHREIDWIALDTEGTRADLAVLLLPFRDSAPSCEVRRIAADDDGGHALDGPRCYVVDFGDLQDYLVIADGRPHSFGQGLVRSNGPAAVARVRNGVAVATAGEIEVLYRS